MSKDEIEETARAPAPGESNAVPRSARTNAMTQGEVDDLMESLPARDSAPSPFYALTFPNYRLFFIGQTISVAGTWMQTVAQQWFVYDLTHSPQWLGIVSGASAIPYVLFSFAGGSVADRYSRRSVLLWTQFAAMLIAFLLAFLAWGGWVAPKAWHIAVIAGLFGIVNAYNLPAQQAFVSDLVDDRKALGNAIALNSLRFNTARVLGPMLAGFVLVRSGAAMCFLVNAFSYVAVIFSLSMMRLKPFERRQQKASIWEGFRYIRSNRAVLRVVLLIGLASLLAWPVSTLYPVFAANFRVGAHGFSAMVSANGIGAALSGLTLAYFGDRLRRRALVYGGAFLFGAALLLFSFAGHYYLALALLALSGFAMIAFGISCNTHVQEQVPDELRGRVMAVYSLVFQGLMPLGGLEAGFLAEDLNAALTVRLNAVLFLAIALAIFGWSLLDHRRSGNLLPNQ